jgi:hypothetical protein
MKVEFDPINYVKELIEERPLTIDGGRKGPMTEMVYN